MTTPVLYRHMLADSSRWHGFRFRAGDIVITTPPKCGTTWTQMICALLVFQTPAFRQRLEFVSPWLDMLTRPLDSVLQDLEEQTHRRFIKTHTPLDGLPYDDRVTYLCVGRDPRDVAVSRAYHQDNSRHALVVQTRNAVVTADGTAAPVVEPTKGSGPVSVLDRFWSWVDDATPITESAATLVKTLHHLELFWSAPDQPNLVLLHYADLTADLAGQMRCLAERLDIAIDADRWPELVEAAGFAAMRDNADRLTPSASTGFWRDTTAFFHRGTSGQWRELLSAADLERYHRRVGALVPSAMADWLHHGSPA